jgi:outer membrane cobalamin receptor
MGQQLARRSKKSISLNIYRESGLGTFNLNLSAFDKRKDFGGVILPEYSLIHLSFVKEISDQLAFSMRLENILDKEYFTASGFNGYYQNQGRSLWLNATYKLRQ